MARKNLTHKPGEKAPVPGQYYCYVCSLREIDSTCHLEGGQVFVQCPKCLERKVPEWDLTWKASRDKPGTGRRSGTPSPWPGSLVPDA